MTPAVKSFRVRGCGVRYPDLGAMFMGHGCRAFRVSRSRVLGFQGEGLQWCRGGLVFKAHRLFASFYTRLESNKEEAAPPHLNF